MYCSKCGTDNDDDSKFCICCGIGMSPDKSSGKKPEKKSKINFRGLKIPKTVFIILGLLIVLVAVISIPNFKDYNVDNTNVGTIGDASPGQEIQNLKTDNNVKVSIDSIPTGANVYINNAFSGNTPKVVSLPVGNYSLKLNMTGYKAIRTEFNITSDMVRQDIAVTLDPISQ